MANWHTIDIISTNLVFLLCKLRILVAEQKGRKYCRLLRSILNVRRSALATTHAQYLHIEYVYKVTQFFALLTALLYKVTLLFE